MAEVHLQFDGDLEGEEELVFLEDARAAVVVDVVRQRVHDVAQATVYGHVRGALAQRKLKHLQTQLEAKDVLPNINRTQAAERAENAVFRPWRP